MANKIQIRRGLEADLPVLSAGEPAFTTDSRSFYVGTGSGNVNMGGSQWFSGTDMSGTDTDEYSTADAKVGDYYLNTSTGYVYRCTTAGTGTDAKWTYQGSIKGATGATGAAGTVTCDSTLRYSSEKPVQNSIVSTAIYIAAAIAGAAANALTDSEKSTIVERMISSNWWDYFPQVEVTEHSTGDNLADATLPDGMFYVTNTNTFGIAGFCDADPDGKDPFYTKDIFGNNVMIGVGETAICGPIYTDTSGAYGNCFVPVLICG